MCVVRNNYINNIKNIFCEVFGYDKFEDYEGELSKGFIKSLFTERLKNFDDKKLSNFHNNLLKLESEFNQKMDPLVDSGVPIDEEKHNEILMSNLYEEYCGNVGSLFKRSGLDVR